MQIPDEIFEEFFKNLDDENLPELLIAELRILRESEKDITKEKLLEIIEKYQQDDGKDKTT